MSRIPGGRQLPRSQRERGSAAVEMALIAPLVCALVFGIIDFGTVMSNRINLRQGTQQAARQATVGSFGSSTSCALDPAPADANTKALLCTAKDRIGLGDAIRV